MSRGNFIKKSYKAILYWAVFAIVAITLIALSATSLAKYVYSGSAGGSADVTGVGVEVFELIESWQKQPEADDKTDDGETDDGETDGETTTEVNLSYDTSKIIPGVDMAAPRIKLKINSSVNYSLYIKVSVPKFDFVNFGGVESDISKQNTLVYKMYEFNWQEEESLRTTAKVNNVEYTVYTFKYVLADGNSVFQAGTSYDYSANNSAIQILEDDTIFVSQYFKGKDIQGFKLSFEAYVRQVQTQS